MIFPASRMLRCVTGSLLLASLLRLGTVALAQEPAKQPLRVMTFNIRYDTPSDGENAWPKRKEMVASLVRDQRADLVGVQEALGHQIDDLTKLLPGYEWIGAGRDDGKDRGEFVPVFYRSDRLKPLEHGYFWLSEMPDRPGSKGWDAVLPRIVTWVKFEDKDSGRSFYHFNTHFDHIGSDARRESAKLLRQRIGQTAGDKPVVLTLDLNALESHSPYEILTDKIGGAESEGTAADDATALRDARYASAQPHEGPTTTWNGFAEPVANTKIDYVFVRGPVSVLKHAVLPGSRDGRYPSDHFPVAADIVISHE